MNLTGKFNIGLFLWMFLSTRAHGHWIGSNNFNKRIMANIANSFPREKAFLVIDEALDIDILVDKTLTILNHLNRTLKISNLEDCLLEHKMALFKGDNSVHFCLEQTTIANPNATKTTSLFNNVWIVPEKYKEKLNFKLRLDSKIFTYLNLSDHKTFKEIYAVKGIPYENIVCDTSEHFEDHLNLALDFWDRRSNLSSVSLIASTMNWPPFSILTLDKSNNILNHKGLFADIWKLLQKKMNFQYTEMIPEDGFWGGTFPNGSWNGLVGQLHRKEIDVSLAALTIINERSKVIDYCVGIYADAITLVMNVVQNRQVNYWAFISIFSIDSWAIIFSSLVSLAIAYYVLSQLKYLNHGYNTTSQSNILKNSKNYQTNVIQTLSIVAIILLQRDHPLQLKSTSSKVLYFTTCISGFLLFAFYSGVLTSLMTSRTAPTKIRRFEDVLTLNIDLYVLGQTAQHVTLKEAKPGTPLNNLYNNYFQNNPNSIAKDRSEIIDILNSNPGMTAEIGSSVGASQKPGLESLVLDDQLDNNFAFAVQKNSEFKGIFDFYLTKLVESGILDQVKRQWIESSAQEKINLAEANVLGYYDLIFPYFIFLGGILSGIILFHFEYLFHRFHIQIGL